MGRLTLPNADHTYTEYDEQRNNPKSEPHKK